MRPSSRAVMLILTALAVATTSTAIQAQGPVRLGLGGGFTLPVGDVGS